MYPDGGIVSSRGTDVHVFYHRNIVPTGSISRVW
jgi:hypothetical protein